MCLYYVELKVGANDIMIIDTLKKIFYWFFERIIKLFDSIFSIFTNDHISNVMRHVCMAVESENLYVAYYIKPKDTVEIPILDDLDQSHSFAIILQGPICTKDNMTLNSIRFYKKVYPYAVIIVSTWNDESEKELNKLAKQGALIVKNEKPSNSGILNINYQLVNSLAGVEKAKELGCTFAVKTRTDQRVCKPYIFDSMLSALKLFPGGDYQKGRLVVLGECGGGMFIPFHSCDFLYLGYTDDLVHLFSAPLDKRNDDKDWREIGSLLTRRKNFEQMIAPEIYILKHYCSDVLRIQCEGTVESYWYVVKNYLICYGMKDIDLMWNKYDLLYNLNFYSSAYDGDRDSSERLQTMCFDYFNWLNLYMGNIRYDKRYEKYADVTLFPNKSKKNY